MAKNFASIAFTNAVKAVQEKFGSRVSYARVERDTYINGLTENEIDFIEQRDSFYMASIGENNFPYIQHRGGPKGFVKVLDDKRIGFIDFKGNMQYISVGNIAVNNNVALIMVDYPSKTRLKILAKAEVIELKDNPELYNLLNLNDYHFKPERMMVFNIEAYDWNCPKHIVARYTVEDIAEVFAAQKDHITQLETEIKSLKAKLREASQSTI
ncbi:pyridoxamine 5'-phosphate oxidase family protein [Ferruginibacter lapsinanis]|uniref:pyridoxamine 5'-phosphate oxidase family protein n=1 Tax=Ferruginibacter lapsinanis TaxID=563172 RepID=UPI001E3C5F0C|nr:pyridoxamine 5'-phosphate oxidase family protein [Ferruginibacter lapsinanis]UEG49633.1 pyridoxamine 5'-phosphate oxidase family protein [Ferruginibacter lapsinanis]